MKFKSPDHLWRYLLFLSSKMYIEGYVEQAKILEEKTKMPCTTGGEWFSELSIAVHDIRKMGKLPNSLEEELEVIFKTLKSNEPYCT